MASATSITGADFNDALSRYPALISSISKSQKPGSLTLEQLDRYRYIEAPASFSKNTGRTMEIEDVKKLVDWKLRHGTFRPSLPKLVASNSNEKVAAATKEAFEYYASHPTEISETLRILAEPLKGIGPATASLLLAVHDPKNVIFFSDEVFRWLCTDGRKAISPKYTTKEFRDLSSKAKELMVKLKVSPIEIEQVAFVLIKENEPVYVPKPKKEPSGLPRGRPAKPDSEKKAKPVPVPGRGRGRPAKGNAVAPKALAIKATGKGRGRPPKARLETPEEEAKSPASKGNKRKAIEEPSSARHSGKKAKA